MASYLVDMSSSSHAPVFMEEVRARFSRDASCRSGQPSLLVAAAAVTKSVVASSVEDIPLPSKRIPLLPTAAATADLHSGYDNSYALMPTSLPSNPNTMQALLPEKGSGKKRERAKGSSSRGAAKRLKLDPEGAFETSLEATADGAEEAEAQQKFQQQPPPPPPPAAKRRNRQRQKKPLTTDEDAGEKVPPKRRNKPKTPCQFPNPSLSQPLVPQPISAPNAQTKNYLDVYGLKVKVNKASDISKFIEDYTVEDLLMRNPKPLFSPFFVAEQGQSHDTFGYQIGEVLQLLPKQGSVASSNMMEKKPPPLPPVKYALDLESLPQSEDDFQYGPSDIDQYMSQSSSSHEFSAGSLPLYSFGEFVKSVELPPSNSLEYLISKSDSTVPPSTANKLHLGANSFEENDGTVMRTWLRAGTLTTETVGGGDSLNGVRQWEANNKNRTATPIKGSENPVPATDNCSVAVAFSCLDIDLNKESPPEEDNETNLEYDFRIRQGFRPLLVDAKEEEEDTNDNDRRWHGDRDSTPCKNGKEEPASSTRERKEDKSPRTEIRCDEGKNNNLGNSSSAGKDLEPGHSVNGDENPSSIPASGDHAEHPPPPPSGQDFCDDGPISPRVHAAAHLLWSFTNSHRGKLSSTSHTQIQGAKKSEEERLSEVSSLPSVPVPLPVPKRRASKKSRNSAPPLPLVVASPSGQERASSGISASTSNNNNNDYKDEFCTNNTNKIKRKKKEGRHNQNRNDEQENYRTLPDIASIPSKRTPDQTTVVSTTTTTTTNNNNTAKRQQQQPKTARYHPQTCSLRELDKAKTSNNNNNNNNNPPPPAPAAPLTINGNVTTNAIGSSGSRTHVIKIRPQSPPQNNNNSAGGSPGNSSRHMHPFFGVVSQRARN